MAVTFEDLAKLVVVPLTGQVARAVNTYRPASSICHNVPRSKRRVSSDSL